MATEQRGTSGGVVVGTDGSSAAERAVDWAADEAVRRGTGLHVLYAFPWESQARAWEFTPSPELHKTGERVVAASVERIGRPGLSVTSEVLVEDPATALVAGSVGADLVVVGARGLGEDDEEESVMGSVAQKVTAHAHTDVVVVRGTSPAGPDAPVVVGMDPAEGAPEAMEYAFEEARRRDVPLIVVQGAQDDIAFPNFPDALVTGQYDPASGEYARVTAERLSGYHDRFPDVPVELRLVRERPVRALVRAAEEASIVVVGRSGRSGLLGLLLGSVSWGVASRAPVVAVVRAPDDATD